jgi:sec-independent protein translocase protein TatC
VDERQLSLTEHLAELRSRLAKALAACVIGAFAAWSFREEIFAALLRPAVAALPEQGARLQAIAPAEIFFTYMKGAILAGFVLALPVVFYQLWAFVAPGLYPSEKRMALPFVLVSTLLFLLGAGFGHLVVFPVMFQFLSAFENELVAAAWTMHAVFNLTTRMFLAFGLAFETPVVVFFLAAAGIVSPRDLLRGFPYAVLVCFVVGAILTPPDWVSQVLLAVPMSLLYLLGVGFAWVAAPRRRSETEGHASLPVPVRRSEG